MLNKGKSAAKKAMRSRNKKIRKKIIKWFILRKIALPFIFKKYSRKPIDKKMVVFADDRSKVMKDNMQALFDELSTMDYNIVLLLQPDVPKNKIKKQLINFKYYCRFTKYYAQAKYVVVADYYPPLYANEARPETKVIQLWHACGAFKKWGYSTLNSKWGLGKDIVEKYPIHTHYTHAIVSAKEVAPHYAEAFNMSQEKVYAYGVPRTDVFFDNEYKKNARKKLFDIISEKRKDDVLDDYTKEYLRLEEKREQESVEINEAIGVDVTQDELYKQKKEEELLKYLESKEDEIQELLKAEDIENKKVILYAPTYRGNSIRKSYNRNVINIELLRYFLKDEYCLVYKLHPLVRKNFGIGKFNRVFAFDVSDDMHINEALSAADILISDYSSLIFEYALLERPMIFYAYDHDDYIDARGFYYDYDKFLPGPIVKNNYELLDSIQNVNEWFDMDKVRRFKEKFMDACDGNSTQRILDKVFIEKE